MEIGIIGLPQSGKTTTFNSLVHGSALTGIQSPAAQNNLGVAHIRDLRLDELAEMYSPLKVVPAEVRYTDIPGQPPGRNQGIRGEYLLQLSQVDALLHVVRSFKNDTVAHIEGTIDPLRDLNLMELELIFSDLTIIDRQLERINANQKGARGQEKDRLQQNLTVLTNLKKELELETPIRNLPLLPEEMKSISDYQFLTAKPLLTLLNISENELESADTLLEQIISQTNQGATSTTYLPAKLEEELAQLNEEEASEFRQSMDLPSDSLERVTRESQKLLGQISFFTVGSDEVRAWNIKSGMTAPEAAGKIHTDIERGFIRAEIIGYQDLIDSGTENIARQRGLLRQEGKTYIVQEGDIINFLFNV